MKQVFVDEGHGTPFITSGGIFLKTLTTERYLRNQLLGEDETWRINEYDTLIARSGQVGGIIGRGVCADSRLDGFAASPHILRLRSTSEEFPHGYVNAFLCLTDVGYQLLARTAAGSSIPFLPLDAVLEIKIPTTPSLHQRQEIDELVNRRWGVAQAIATSRVRSGRPRRARYRDGRPLSGERSYRLGNPSNDSERQAIGFPSRSSPRMAG